MLFRRKKYVRQIFQMAIFLDGIIRISRNANPRLSLCGLSEIARLHLDCSVTTYWVSLRGTI